MDWKTLVAQTERLRIIVAEDYEPLRVELSEMLGELFREVAVCSDGEAALQAYRSGDYDLLLSDIQMPKRNGVELARAIRESDETFPIIILSAHTETEHLLELINIGISQFVTKPIENDAFFDTLYRVCSKIDNVRKLSPAAADIMDLGNGWRWHKAGAVLYHGDEKVELTLNEWLIFSLLTEHCEEVCTTQQIVEYFYDHGKDLSANSIRNLMLRVRKKTPEGMIQSVYGLGYKLVLPS